jgi:acyl-CoA oxidase
MALAQEQRLAGELRRSLDNQAADTPFERWNPLLDAARELGEAYATRLAAESLARTLESVEDPELRTVLRPLTALYGVVEARRNAATLMGVGLLAPDLARSLPVVLDQLCEQVAPGVPLLLEAMGLPDDLVRAPMGTPDFLTALAGSAAEATPLSGGG